MNLKQHKKIKGIICYFSTTGNTAHLAYCLSSYLSDFPIELCDMSVNPTPNPLHYDFFGFASPVEFFGLPPKVLDWIKSIPVISKPRYAFIMLTHSSISGTAMIQFKELLQARNFNIIAGHTLKCPESYPPLRSKGFTFSNAPGPGSLKRFLMFAKILKDLLHSASEGRVILEAKFRLSFINYFFSPPGRNIAHHVMGFKYLDAKQCVQCGLCARDCPYSAIHMMEYPKFDETHCKGCWKCYNRCPAEAIYTSYLKGKGHYQETSESFKNKISKILSLK